MNKKGTLYMDVYNYYKDLIEKGMLKEGDKLPSIRRCSIEREVSKTTVEQAYMCLCDDGYVMPKNQSGYYVMKRNNISISENSLIDKNNDRNVLYDFASSGVDAESFDMDIWKRYMKSALRHNKELSFYGEPQGEYELRCEIAKYVKQTRNCVCNAENIVIGAGVQTLLVILCHLLKDKKTVSFDNLSYKQGTTIFKDFGFKVSTNRNNSNILYVSPSYSLSGKDSMNVAERFSLTEYAKKNNKIIIEDDYGSEFRYINRPIPSLQGLDGGNNVVYLGTFSKVLLPSIRISFMILPTNLKEKYMKCCDLYNQTVSKAEQIALCSYLRDGNMNSQIRKSRKLYMQKSKQLKELLKEHLENKIEIVKSDSPLFIRCKLKCNMSTEEFCKKAMDNGVALIPLENTENYANFAFSVSSVGVNHFQKAVEILENITKVSY